MNARPCLALVLASVALAGCGGEGGSHGSSTSTSPFGGGYSGSYAETPSTASATTGTLSITVANDGSITGSGTDSDFSGEAGKIVSGSKITSAGATTFKVTYVAQGSDETTVLTGTLALDSTATTLSGTLTTTLSGTTSRFNVTLTRVVAG